MLRSNHKIGIIYDNLPQELKQKYKTNKGVIVNIVINDTPAFKNDILQGDIITKINGKTVYDLNSAMEIMNGLQDENDVVLNIIRDKEKITKRFKMD